MKLLAKHVKYDLLKYKNALLAVLIGSGVIEMAHIIAYLTEFKTLYVITVIILMIALFSAFFVLLIYSIGIFSIDLSKKQGYMPFSTPTTSRTLIGSKIITTLIVSAATIVLILLYGGIDSYLAAREAEPGLSLGYAVKTILDELDGSWGYIAVAVINLIAQWVCNILTIYLALALSAALLGESKLKGLVSFGLWIGVNVVLSIISVIVTKIFGNIINFNVDAYAETPAEIFSVAFGGSAAALAIGLNVVVAVGIYFLTCWITEKKLSL
ncbi:MAG: hypothetical protein E7510_00610 [Ruminococcus sp.]|nr:hypothetical protein [Ruminococcus sp.]